MSIDIYVTAAFKSVRQNQAYIFMGTEYVLEDYAPDSKDDKFLYGPSYMRDLFSSLKGTVFGEEGIDCAFASEDKGIAYIFSGNICAKWFYGPDSTRPANDKIIDGPKPIAEMFPFLKGTIFADGIDAVIEISSLPYEAYLFKGDQYGRIDYGAHGGRLKYTAIIRDSWLVLRGTVFENGFDAAFTLHTPNEAYIFKGDTYARIKFTPDSPYEKLVSLAKIKGSFNELGSILPRTQLV